MRKVAVVTDSNSGITQSLATKLNVFVLPMPFYVNGELYHEDITMSQTQFYTFLEENAEISTSQPSPSDVTDFWDKVLAQHDELVYIPMSSGLSGSCDTANMLARDYDGRVAVVDNHRISVTMLQSVLDAKKLADEGKSANQIKDALEKAQNDSSIYITVETLYYLKKGGRITPAAALIGSMLKIKPVLQIQGGKLDAYTKVVGKRSARSAMLKAMKKDFAERFNAEVDRKSMRLFVAYSGNETEADGWLEEVRQNFPDFVVEKYPLSLSVSCHIGKGALAIACANSL